LALVTRERPAGCHDSGVGDGELTARVRGLVASGPGSDSIFVTQPVPGEVVVQAHPSSNYVVVLTPKLRGHIEATLREWMPGLTKVRFDPHH
jgi:hypothetical protein